MTVNMGITNYYKDRAEEVLDSIRRKYDVDLNQEKLPIRLNIRREELPKLFNQFGYRKGIEIGVFKGYFSNKLLYHNPKAEIYSIDPWLAYKDSKLNFSQEFMEECYEGTVEKLAPYKNSTIMRMSSIEASKEFEDNSLDFAYIDGNHELFEVVQDIGHWIKKIKNGGIIAGHDYVKKRGVHVKYAVNAWTYSYGIRPWFLCTRGYATWFWVVK